MNKLKTRKSPLFLYLIIWTLVFLTLFLLQMQFEKDKTFDLAKNEAISKYRSDLHFRSWMSSHGGVYIPVSEEISPNPYLEKIPEQNLVTPGGKELTLMNPAWAIRNLNEYSKDSAYAKSHITSLNLLRPENAPDDWERSALMSFENGVMEVYEISEISNEPYFRYMKPLTVETGCLKCHESQGYEVGDVRGGISVYLPFTPYLEIERKNILQHGSVLLFIYLIVILIINTTSKVINRRNLEIEESAKQLEEANISLKDEIEKQKAAEREKENMLFQLNHKSKMDGLGQLAGGVAHDFNNILHGISNSAQLLQMPLRNLDGKSRKYVDMIIAASARGTNLTNQLLAYSRNEKGNYTSVNLHQVVDEIIDFLRSSIDMKIQISVDKDARDFQIWGDADALGNTITNLIINSSQAISGHGKIAIKSRNIHFDEKSGRTLLYDVKPGRYCEIEIQDSGSGIPEDIRDNIFDPFFTTKPTGFGTGLGLTQVYSTVQKHKGSIGISSDTSTGTSVKIAFPCLIEPQEAEQKGKSVIKGKGTILLVDDEEINRITGADILATLGYETIVAENGKDAIEKFKANHSAIDIVLLDMIMPVMDGREAFIALKEFDKDCKVIISSGYAKDSNIDKLIDQGLRGFIRKPFKLTDLSQIVYETIGISEKES